MMNKEKVKNIIKVVSDALGSDIRYFDIKESEILDEDEDYFSMMVSIRPKKDMPLPPDHIVQAKGDYLQIDLSGGEYKLMVGEDGDIELDVDYGNIYAHLYWGTVLKEI